MFGLYRPKILLFKEDGGEKLGEFLSESGIDIFTAEDPKEAAALLGSTNIDALVLVLNPSNNKVLKFLSKIPSYISVILVEEKSGEIVPEEWKEKGDIILRMKTAKETLANICFDLIEQRKVQKKAA